MPASVRPLPLLFLTSLAACGLAPPAAVPDRAAEPVALVIEPDAGPAAILDLIAGARRSVWMEMYLLTDARAVAALADRARAGCDVRVILEPAPYLNDGANQAAADTLSAAGVTSAGRHRGSPTRTPRC